MNFVNVFVDFKTFDKSYEYINDTFKDSQHKINKFVVVDNSLDDNFEKLINLFSVESIKKDTLFDKNIIFLNAKIDGFLCEIIIVNTNENLGYGKGNNLGVKIANEVWKDVDIILISNNDMKCLDECMKLDKIEKIFSEKKDVGCIGVSNNNLDGSNQSPAKKMGIFSRWIRKEIFFPLGIKFKAFSSNDIIKMNEDGYCYRVRGSFMFLLNKAYQKSGGFDENIFLYCEEPILSERLLKVGYKIFFVCDFHMLHNHIERKNGTSNELKKTRWKLKSEMYYYKNYLKTSLICRIIVYLLYPFYYLKMLIFYKLKRKK